LRILRYDSDLQKDDPEAWSPHPPCGGCEELTELGLRPDGGYLIIEWRTVNAGDYTPEDDPYADLDNTPSVYTAVEDKAYRYRCLAKSQRNAPLSRRITSASKTAG
jgi:hypothetical protein